MFDGDGKMFPLYHMKRIGSSVFADCFFEQLVDCSTL